MFALRSSKSIVQRVSQRCFSSATAVAGNERNVKSDEKQFPDNNDLDRVVMRGVTGTVSWFSPDKEYGFIKRDDNGEDIFCHLDGIVRRQPARFTLEKFLQVEFDVVTGRHGKVRATAVTLLDGYPIENTRRMRYNNNGRFDSRTESNVSQATEDQVIGKLFGEFDPEKEMKKQD